MGTPVAPNCANFLIKNFEQNLLRDSFQKNWIITFDMVLFYWQYFVHIDR